MGNLSTVRRAAGFSRIELAEITGISDSTLARYEKGETNPRRSNVKHLSQVLGVSARDLDGPDPLENLVI